MGTGMRVIRFHRKLEFLTMAKVNRGVWHDEGVLTFLSADGHSALAR